MLLISDVIKNKKKYFFFIRLSKNLLRFLILNLKKIYFNFKKFLLIKIKTIRINAFLPKKNKFICFGKVKF